MNQLKAMFELNPSNRDHIPAFRIAFGIAVPLLLLLAINRLDLAIYATFGAFTGLFARHESRRSRFLRQSLAGTILTLCALTGAIMSWYMVGFWVIVVVTSFISSGAAMLAAQYNLRPAGSIFFVFAVSAIASIHGGQEGVHPLLATVVAAVTAGFCVVLGAFAHLIGEGPQPGSETLPDQTYTHRELRGHGLRFFIAPLVAGFLGVLSVTTIPELSHPYWAMVAGVAPLTPPHHAGRIQRALQRILGTLAGVVTAAFLLSFPTLPWQVVVWIIILQFLGEIYIGRNYALALTFITPVALMMTQMAHPIPVDALLLARTIETVIGAFVAMGIVALGYSIDNPHIVIKFGQTMKNESR
ncbi:FUSC family protein [Corynebacterium anserum]|uniref:FUSC family protein n=1 Tax=Corynebacterium anserum TaxID=2684406 RepID=A0A7G7YPB6_9CORY|nr:FUSC family protein [Corynebacterium anserum]MBC2681947.1 FUSC family protein [Corynebacterium anserum]QNH96336.1 FUSC family protein [Corynebacterium anserum]